MVVTHSHFRCGEEIDVSEDTAHAEHVLAFQIGAVAPAEDLHGECVLALDEMGGDVKFGDVVCALCVAHIFSIHPDQGGGVDAVEVKEDALAVPSVGHAEGLEIGADRVDAVVLSSVVEARSCLDEGRRVGVRIFHVGVDGSVVALHFPVGRHGNRVPGGGVEAGLEEVEGAL